MKLIVLFIVAMLIATGSTMWATMEPMTQTTVPPDFPSGETDLKQCPALINEIESNKNKLIADDSKLIGPINAALEVLQDSGTTHEKLCKTLRTSLIALVKHYRNATPRALGNEKRYEYLRCIFRNGCPATCSEENIRLAAGKVFAFCDTYDYDLHQLLRNIIAHKASNANHLLRFSEKLRAQGGCTECEFAMTDLMLCLPSHFFNVTY